MTTLLAPPFTDTALADYLNHCPAIEGWSPWAVWGDVVSDLDSLAIWVADPHDADSVQGLVGYFFHGLAALGGEWDCGPILDAPNGGQIYLFYLDGTKSRRDDLFSVISDEFPALLRDGSPVRKTDRSGPGTLGTRKHAGLHGPRAVAWR